MFRLFRVIIPSSDLDISVAFYTALLALEGRRILPGRHHFDCGGVDLVCFSPRDAGYDRDPEPNSEPVYLATDDVEAAFERARRLHPAVMDEAIVLRPWGERSFYLHDPLGNIVCLVDAPTALTAAQPAD
jgi:catechol 2,3-dioxygenase-like lactoylglutathione lyase family enzyme